MVAFPSSNGNGNGGELRQESPDEVRRRLADLQRQRDEAAAHLRQMADDQRRHFLNCLDAIEEVCAGARRAVTEDGATIFHLAESLRMCMQMIDLLRSADWLFQNAQPQVLAIALVPFTPGEHGGTGS